MKLAKRESSRGNWCCLLCSGDEEHMKISAQSRSAITSAAYLLALERTIWLAQQFGHVSIDIYIWSYSELMIETLARMLRTCKEDISIMFSCKYLLRTFGVISLKVIGS